MLRGRIFHGAIVALDMTEQFITFSKLHVISMSVLFRCSTTPFFGEVYGVIVNRLIPASSPVTEFVRIELFLVTSAEGIDL